MGDSDPPRFRIRPLARLVAAALAATSIGIAIWNIVVGGTSGIAGAVLFAAFAVCAALVVRVEVQATPSELVINNVWRTRRIPWTQVEGFRVEEGGGQRRVLVLVTPNEAVALPIANGGLLLTRKREARAVRDALQGYRNQRA